MNWCVYTVRVVLVLFGFVLLVFFFNPVNKFEFLKSAYFVVAGFGLVFYPPCCFPKVDLYISDT